MAIVMIRGYSDSIVFFLIHSLSTKRNQHDISHLPTSKNLTLCMPQDLTVKISLPNRTSRTLMLIARITSSVQASFIL